MWQLLIAVTVTENLPVSYFLHFMRLYTFKSTIMQSDTIQIIFYIMVSALSENLMLYLND